MSESETDSEIATNGALSDAARAMCRRVVRYVRMGAPGAAECVAPTGDDDGMVLEFSWRDRSVCFVVPNDGARLYFVAREGETRCAAGICSGNDGALDLADWLAGMRLDTRGLVVG